MEALVMSQNALYAASSVVSEMCKLVGRGRLCVVVCLAVLGSAQTALTNDSILKMLKAGLAEDVVVSSILTQPAQYATAPDDLIALKEAGVSDKIISAMVAKARGGSSPRMSAPTGGSSGNLPEPEFINNVYWFDRGSNKLVALERGKVDTTGKGKFFVGGAKLAMEISGERSPVRFTADSKPDFVFLGRRNVDPQDQAKIFRLTLKKGHRELITAQTRGIMRGIHSGEENKEAVPFEATKHNENSIRITPAMPLPRGEYAIRSGANEMFCFGVD
jgi:hypothetical protein